MDTARILLIEDDDDNATICTVILEHFGMLVSRAATGPEALSLARESPPDLVLLDISLPGLSGWDVAAALREDIGAQQVPIVMWSAHDTATDRARAADLGCQGYLTKPCAPLDLAREVERQLAVAREGAAERAQVVGWVGERWRVRLPQPSWRWLFPASALAAAALLLRRSQLRPILRSLTAVPATRALRPSSAIPAMP